MDAAREAELRATIRQSMEIEKIMTARNEIADMEAQVASAKLNIAYHTAKKNESDHPATQVRHNNDILYWEASLKKKDATLELLKAGLSV